MGSMSASMNFSLFLETIFNSGSEPGINTLTFLFLQSFNKTSDIMLDSANDLYERITQELILDFKATYGPISRGLGMYIGEINLE